MARSLWVLIAAAGKPALLERTLRSLAAVQKPASYRGTLVVENGTRCGIEAVVRGFSAEYQFRHLYVPEANKSHALNRGLSLLDEGLAFMTDDDVRLHPRILTAYAEAAKHAERGEYYGGPVLIDAEHGLPPAWMRRYYPQTIAEPWSLWRDRPIKPDQSFMGTNWAAFVGDLVAAGGFDTRLGPGGTTGAAGQETEAQRRLVTGGGRPVYVPDAIAWHYLHREFLDTQWLMRRTYRHGLEWGIRRTKNAPAITTMVRALAHRAAAHAKGFAFRVVGGEQRRFKAEFHEAKWRGRWDGLWLGMEWDKLPQMGPPLPSGRRRAA